MDANFSVPKLAGPIENPQKTRTRIHTVRMTHGGFGLLHELRTLAVLLEERNVSRAALRFRLNQSSMSRSLQRLRGQFGDELLVRAGGEYELTPRAREIQRELAVLLPRMENLLTGQGFDPATAAGVVRVIGTDYTTATLGSLLLPRLIRAAPRLEFRIDQRDQDSYADLERGRADLAMSPMRPAAPLKWEQLFTDDTVCVVDRDHPVQERFSLDEYVAARHVVVTPLAQEQPLVERWLQNHGRRRTAALRVTHFSASTVALPGTALVATIPRRLTEVQDVGPRLRVVEAPEEFDALAYGMVWHERLDADPRHGWLREMVRAAARDLVGPHCPADRA